MGAAPTLSGRSTSPTIIGSDLDGFMQTGATGTVSGCRINFSTAFTNAPLCTVTYQTASQISNYNTAAGHIGISTNTNILAVNYHCAAQSGG